MRPACRLALALAPLVATVATVGSSAAEPVDWQLLRSEAAGLEIQMPGEPRYEFTRRWTIVGRLAYHHYSVVHPLGNYDAERIEMPALAVYFLSADSLLDRARDDLMEEVDGAFDGEERFEIAGHPARHLRFRRPADHLHPEETWLVLADHYLYILTVGPYQAPLRATLVEPFFSSFRFCVPDLNDCREGNFKSAEISTDPPRPTDRGS